MCVNAVIDEMARSSGATPADFPFPTNQLARDLYIAVNGQDPADPSAQGTMPLKMFAWWQQNAILGYRLKTAIPVQADSEYELRRVVESVGYVGLIVRLSEAQQNAGPWDYVPGSPTWAEHAVLVDEYGPDPLDCTSWGERQPIMSGFIQQQTLAAFNFQLIKD